MYTSISLKSDSFPALIELSPGLKIDTHDTQQYSNPSTFVPLTADRFRIVGGTERPVESCNDDAGTSTLIGRPRYSTRAASSKDVVLGTIDPPTGHPGRFVENSRAHDTLRVIYRRWYVA